MTSGTEYTEYQAFSPVVRIGTPPPPHTQATVYTPLWWGGGGGGGETEACGRGGPNTNEGTDTVVLL